MSRRRGEPNAEGIELRHQVAEHKRGLAHYTLPPYTTGAGRSDCAGRLLATADEIDAGTEPLRLCVTRRPGGDLTTWHEGSGTGLPRGRWVDIDGGGRMTPVPAQWVEWHDGRLAALRRASRNGGADAAAKAAAEWDARKPQ